MTIKYLLAILGKIICILAFLLGSIAYAQTEYKQLEKFADLTIFSKYADFLSTTSNPYALFSKITIEDKAWLAISNKHYNTISNVYYSPKGYIVRK